MAVDNSKLNYFSAWDIDQLVASGEVAVASGTTILTAVPAGLPAVAVFEVYFKPGSGSRWYRAGIYSTNGALSGQGSFYSIIANKQLYIATTTNGIARYFIWQDKVDY